MLYNIDGISTVAVHDIFDPLPLFMHRADVIFVDPPYNQALLTNFSNMQGAKISEDNPVNFTKFTDRLFECIAEIAPRSVFIEMGKEYTPDYVLRVRDLYKYTTFYNSTYAHKPQSKCYIIYGTNDVTQKRLQSIEDRDEEDVIKWITSFYPYKVIGDLCMGLGLVGINAHRAGKPFVGTELNQKRLLKMLDSLQKRGANVKSS